MKEYGFTEENGIFRVDGGDGDNDYIYLFLSPFILTSEQPSSVGSACTGSWFMQAMFLYNLVTELNRPWYLLILSVMTVCESNIHSYEMRPSE